MKTFRTLKSIILSPTILTFKILCYKDCYTVWGISALQTQEDALGGEAPQMNRLKRF